MNQLEAGPELDRLVAEAVGWDPYEDGDLLEPSTDWNAAMAAAEAIPLLNIRRYSSGVWEVSWHHDPSLLAPSVKAPTGPLAICRAILALKEKGNGNQARI